MKFELFDKRDYICLLKEKIMNHYTLEYYG